jgi:transcriptional regulator with XRE-family HTH domain
MNLQMGRQISTVLVRLRSDLGLTQAAVAQKAGIDQSRVSRIEKGEVDAPPEVDRVVGALIDLGSKDAPALKSFLSVPWHHIEPPSFWNPQRGYMETAEEVLQRIQEFLQSGERPWPLIRQIERHRESLLRASTFLSRLNHNVAFIGDIGVGKSTALSFLFDLLVPSSMVERPIQRPVLETGAGGTTICEVHIKRGPEFGISLLPMNDSEIRQLVSDFAATKWMTINQQDASASEAELVSVSREAERAIRNMTGLTRRRETAGGKAIWHDPIADLARSCSSEDEFRTGILEAMNLQDRTQRELWYDSATRKHPMEWVTETFKAVNNGRLKQVSLPTSIDLLIPDFGRTFGELEITIIDTKGVDDIALREDLDLRLKDGRTAIVFCSRFNDAPGMTARNLLKHMRETFSDRVDTGKVSILALPRAEEARAMKDDTGEQALTDAEGYGFKGMQIEGELAADDLAGIPMLFFNVESDDAEEVRQKLFEQLSRMRMAVADRLLDLCAAVEQLIEKHETHALTAAIEEVANRLSSFLSGNRLLGARERLPYVDAIETIKKVRYASTLWAATRRGGEYSGLSVSHQIGVGAARDARLRSKVWFQSLDAFLNALKADRGLELAAKTIDQISKSAALSEKAFLEAVQRAGTEVYREPLAKSSVWSTCSSEWGKGKGFTARVVRHLENWFEGRSQYKDRVEIIVGGLWEKLVISPLVRLAEENAPETPGLDSNVIDFPNRLAS